MKRLDEAAFSSHMIVKLLFSPVKRAPPPSPLPPSKNDQSTTNQLFLDHIITARHGNISSKSKETCDQAFIFLV